ncbi:MAG: MFS transporter [Methanomassiliicoccus sp.]|nr:MFS transporter [Methanomassiliicoccus sp.]
MAFPGRKASGPLRAYLINQTAHWFIVGLIFPVLILMVLDKGLTIFEAGTVLAIYSGTTVLLELPTGGLADSLGRRKIYIISVAVHIAAVLLFIFSSDYLTVAMAALVMGIGRALSSGSIDAWFVDEFKAANPQGNLQQALAKANVFVPLGLGAGSLIGGALPMTLGTMMNASLGTSIYAANLVVVLFADLMQIVLTRSVIKETVMVKDGGALADGFRQVPVVVSASLTYGVRNRTVLILLGVMVAFGFAITGLELLWQPRVGEVMGGTAQTWVLGVLAAAYFLITAAGSALVTPICARLGNDNALVMALLTIAMGISMFILAMQAHILSFAALYLTTYLVVGMTNSPYGAMFHEEVPTEQRSTMLSFQSLVMQGGGLAGSVVLGFVAGEAGIPLAWTLAGGVIASSSVALLYLRSRKLGMVVGKGDEVAS